jgi:uncharacterized damage-inducible protein DinB
MEYTQWERNWWQDWFESTGNNALQISTGGERHRTVAELIQHIFGTETRYIQRITGKPITPLNQIPKETAEELFEFGAEERLALRDYVQSVKDWARTFEFTVLDFHMKATVRKFIVHILIHEIRHWAQLAVFLRLGGYEELGTHDLLESDAML